MRKNDIIKKFNNASMTVECAIALPIFVMAVLSLYSLFPILTIYSQMNASLHVVGKEMAYCAYPLSRLSEEQDKENVYAGVASMLAEDAYAAGRLVSVMGKDRIDNSNIRNGAMGINVLRSNPNSKNNTVDLVVTYYADPWFMPGKGIKLENRCKMKKWTGYERPVKDETCEYVYITTNGKVYHTNYDCSYLHPSIHSCDRETVSEKRNQSGSKYYECSKCKNKEKGDTVYITDWGERFHNSIGCSELERNIKAVPLDKVGDRRLCDKCAGYSEGH